MEASFLMREKFEEFLSLSFSLIDQNVKNTDATYQFFAQKQEITLKTPKMKQQNFGVRGQWATIL